MYPSQTSEYRKEYYQKNREHLRSWQNAYVRRNIERYRMHWRKHYNKERHFKYRLKKDYNLTIEEFEQLKLSQSNSCAICKREKKLVVDHCHKTGKVRGLLCLRCNTYLGIVENYPSFLKEAQEYLEKVTH